MGSVIQQTLMFILQFVFGLYSFIIVMRLWVRLIGLDHGHSMLLGIAKATNPVVNKFQKFMPSFGNLEMASVVLLLVVTLVKLLLVSFVSGHIPQPAGLVMWTLISAIEAGLDAVFYMMIIMAILSWIPSAQPAMYSLLTQMTAPLLAPIRRVIPLLGGMDLSPIIILVVVQVIEMLLVHPAVRASLMATFR